LKYNGVLLGTHGGYAERAICMSSSRILILVPL